LGGLPNALVMNSGADMCNTTLLVNESYDTWGNAFTNCQFFGMVDIKSTNRGHVKFNNCGFWARSSNGYCVKTAGAGTVIFNTCHFANYDPDGTQAAIYNDADRLTVNACDFYHPGRKQIVLTANTYTAVIIGNQFRGGKRIDRLSTSTEYIEQHNTTR